MDEKYQIVYSEKPEWGIIGGGISDFNHRQAGEGQEKHMCFVLRATDGKVMGGLIGETHWDWLYISLMWLPEALRLQGHGSRLLEEAEEEARRRGAKHAYLDTFSFQAPGFYKKHGYRVFGELKEFPPGHQRFYMVKEL